MKTLALATCAALLAASRVAANEPGRLLFFSKTSGFRHGSIPTATDALRTIAEQNGFTVDTTEDAADFNTANLAQYQAVLFLMTTGNVLNDSQQAAFEDYIRAGNGYAGLHSATDTEYDWPWYGELVGTYFANHPSIQDAVLNVEVDDHPSTASLPNPWLRRDEWYNFRTNPRGQVTVLATIDESSYNGGTMGADHPIAWFHEFDGGRSWYTAGGHTSSSYSEEGFLAHLLGGLQYAAGVIAAEDTDGDGVFDGVDNCAAVANADQLDTDGDNIGNACDADIAPVPNDCTVNFSDLGALKAAFFGAPDTPNWNPDADFTGDLAINFSDLGVMKSAFFQPPGPGGEPNDCD
ncbi:MAG: ThuA domain-containing protein [Pseudomonadota bacterium]